MRFNTKISELETRAKTQRRKDSHHEEHEEKDDHKTFNISTPPLRQFSPLCAFASLREFSLLSALLLQNLGLISASLRIS